MENTEYARVLQEIAALHRIAGDNHYKVRAFEQAALLVRDLTDPVDDLLAARRVEDIVGIGESVATELQALHDTGVSPRWLELRERIDPRALDWIDVPWLGTRRVQALYHDLGARTLDDIQRLYEQGKLAKHSAFGPVAAEKVAGELARFRRVGHRRIPAPEAHAFAASLCEQFRELDVVSDCGWGGSLRRGMDTVGDIDLAIGSDEPASVINYFRAMPEVMDVKYEGGSRASAILTNEIKVDIWIEPEASFGANLFFVTGPTEHHIALREKVKKRGLKMREHGVVRRDDPDANPIGPMLTEEDVYRSIGLQYIPPEIRGAGKDIELAETHSLPILVQQSDLRGDVHVHGTPKLEEVVSRARELGYQWVCVTERCSRSEGRGCTGDELRQRLEKVRAMDDALEDFRIIGGAEVEILPDGTLDIETTALADCEWVVATITPTRAEIEDRIDFTERVVWGLETGVVSLLASPSGRHLGIDEGVAFDFDAIIDAAVDFGVALELSGDPARLDLNAPRAARAHARGARLALGSNARSPSGLAHISYALIQARRAWLEPFDVLNSLKSDEMLAQVRTLIPRKPA